MLKRKKQLMLKIVAVAAASNMILEAPAFGNKKDEAGKSIETEVIAENQSSQNEVEEGTSNVTTSSAVNAQNNDIDLYGDVKADEVLNNEGKDQLDSLSKTIHISNLNYKEPSKYLGGVEKVEEKELPEEIAEKIPQYKPAESKLKRRAFLFKAINNLDAKHGYAYEQLNPLNGECNAYDTIYEYLDRINKSEEEYDSTYIDGQYCLKKIDISENNLDITQLKKIFISILADHPEYFWLHKTYNYGKDDTGKVVYLIPQVPKQYRTQNQRKEMKEIIDSKIADYVSAAEEGKNDFEKQLIIHDKMGRETIYDYNVAIGKGKEYESINDHNIAGVLCDHVAVCEGYARTMQLILNKCGIKCIFVGGIAKTENSSVEHAWNQVYIDDAWYNLDATWDLDDKENGINYRCFNVKDEDFKEHVPNTPDSNEYQYEVNKCDSDKWNYYSVNNMKFDSENDTIENYVKGRVKKCLEDEVYKNGYYTIELIGNKDEVENIQKYCSNNIVDLLFNDTDINQLWTGKCESDSDTEEQLKNEIHLYKTSVGEIIKLNPKDKTKDLADEITITPESVELDDLKQFSYINVDIKPKTAENTKKITWNISNKDVVEIQNGQIIPLKEGEADITAELENGVKSNTCHIKINKDVEKDLTSPKYVEKIIIKTDRDKDTIDTSLEKTLQLTTEIIPSDADEQDVEWSIVSGNDDNIATISQDGLLTATGNGSGKVKVKVKTQDGSEISDIKEITIINKEEQTGQTDIYSCPKGYNKHDWDKLVNYLTQDSAKDGRSNAEVLRIKLNDVESFGNIVTWEDGSDGEKHLKKLNFHDCEGKNLLAGSLDLEDCVYITNIYIDNSNIESLNIKNLSNLEELDCSYCKLTELELDTNTSLVELTCNDNQITSLNVDENKQLKLLMCGKNNIKDLSITMCNNLETIDFSSDKLENVKLSNTKVNSINVLKSHNINLTLENNSCLERIECRRGTIGSLNLNGNTELKYLYCSNNSITSLELEDCKKLEQIYCDNTDLFELDLSEQSALTDLWAMNCRINSIKISSETNPNLECFYCEKNDIYILDLTNYNELINLRVNGDIFNEFNYSDKIGEGFAEQFFIVGTLKYSNDDQNYSISNNGNGFIYFGTDMLDNEDGSLKARYVINSEKDAYKNNSYLYVCYEDNGKEVREKYSLKDESKSFNVQNEIYDYDDKSILNNNSSYKEQISALDKAIELNIPGDKNVKIYLGNEETKNLSIKEGEQPTANSVVEGSKLEDSTINDCDVIDENGNVVEGTWEWNDKEITLPYGKRKWKAIFKPYDLEKYNIITTEIEVKVKKSASICQDLSEQVSAEDLQVEYNGEEHHIEVKAPEGSTIQYSDKYDGEYSSINPKYRDKGTYTIYYKVTKDGYNDYYGKAQINITDAAVDSIDIEGSDITSLNMKSKLSVKVNPSYAPIGNITWNIIDGNDDNIASINENGEITATGNGNGEITVQAKVSDAYGKLFTADKKISIQIENKDLDKMSVTGNVEAGKIVKGHKLSESSLTGIFKDENNIEVQGKLEWDNPDCIVNSDGKYSWTFTPDDQNMYEILKGNAQVFVNIEDKHNTNVEQENTIINTVYNEDNKHIVIKVDKSIINDLKLTDFIIKSGQTVVSIEKKDDSKTVILTLSDNINKDTNIIIKGNSFINSTAGSNESVEKMLTYKKYDTHTSSSHSSEKKDEVNMASIEKIIKNLCDFAYDQYNKFEEHWISIRGKWYYLDEKCMPVISEWIKYKDKWYYLGQDGVMKTGWFYDEYYKQWYYLNEDGTMKTGWFYDENYGQWYYLKINGSMAHNEYIDGYWLDESGRFV